MIIFEGADNSGKSTAAMSAGEFFRVPVIHTGGKRPRSEMVSILDQMLTVKDLALYDRVSLISEMVYGSILRGDNIIKGCPFITRWSRLMRLKPLIIYCRPPDNILFNLDSHEKKDYDDKAHLDAVELNQRKIVSLYDSLMDILYLHPGISMIKYDWTKGESEYKAKIINPIRRKLDER